MRRTQPSVHCDQGLGDQGLALIELVLAALILSILAAVVVPPLRDGRGDPRGPLVSQRLGILRHAIALYVAQHEELPDDALVEQLTGATPGVDGVPHGPCLRHGVPPSPVSGSRAVRTVASMPAQPEGDEGWIYDTTSGEIRLNAAGGPSTARGRRWFDD